MSAADHHAVLQALDRLSTWMRRNRPSSGMSATAFTTLDTLTFAGPLRISEMAVREGVTQPAMTSLINRLEADGLARRAADPTDGRAALVGITDAGRDTVTSYRRARAALLADRLDALSAQELAALLAALPAIDRLTASGSAPAPSAASSASSSSASSVSSASSSIMESRTA